MESGKSFFSPAQATGHSSVSLGAGIALFQFFSWVSKPEVFPKKIGFSAFLLPVTILTTYVVIYHLIPRYLLPKNIYVLRCIRSIRW